MKEGLKWEKYHQQFVYYRFNHPGWEGQVGG
jgi:hypothetical protein